MGSIKKIRKKYETPMHPWRKERIESERVLVNEYGLRNKKELWKVQSILRGFTRQAKRLVSLDTEQAKKEELQLLKKLASLGLIGNDSKMSDVLTLTIKDVLARRLQTILFRKNLVRSMKQARQLIVHGHVALKGNKVTVPSYLVNKEEENKIGFRATSSLAKEDHPERLKESEMKKESAIIKKKEAKEKKEEKKIENERENKKKPESEK